MTEIQQDIINALQTQITAMADVYNLLGHLASGGDTDNSVRDFVSSYDSDGGLTSYRREVSLIQDLKYNLESKWGK